MKTLFASVAPESEYASVTVAVAVAVCDGGTASASGVP